MVKRRKCPCGAMFTFMDGKEANCDGCGRHPSAFYLCHAVTHEATTITVADTVEELKNKPVTEDQAELHRIRRILQFLEDYGGKPTNLLKDTPEERRARLDFINQRYKELSDARRQCSGADPSDDGQPYIVGPAET